MGWDVCLQRARSEIAVPCPVASVDEKRAFFDEPSARDLAAWLEALPGALPNGPEPSSYRWLGDDGGVMELRPSDGMLFVGHARLEPLLALRSRLEELWPLWYFLDVSRYELHDETSL